VERGASAFSASVGGGEGVEALARQEGVEDAQEALAVVFV
jgi:hypothetical protein